MADVINVKTKLSKDKKKLIMSLLLEFYSGFYDLSDVTTKDALKYLYTKDIELSKSELKKVKKLIDKTYAIVTKPRSPRSPKPRSPSPKPRSPSPKLLSPSPVPLSPNILKVTKVIVDFLKSTTLEEPTIKDVLNNMKENGLVINKEDKPELKNLIAKV